MELTEYELIRSARRTVAVEVRADGSVTVRAPRGMRETDIRRFVADRTEWIQKHVEAARARFAQSLPPISESELVALAEAAREDMTHRAAEFAARAGVSFGKIGIRCQRGRWGSCSPRGDLSFNCLLMLCPPEVRDYVAVHELCHITEPNHSPRFWAEVERVLPGFGQQRAWLRKNGGAVIARRPG